MRASKSRLFRLGIWLLSRLIDRQKHYGLFGDIEEIYSLQVAEKGRLRANLWFWLQVLKTIPAYVINSLYWSLAMLSNYLKITLRNFTRQKIYSTINVAGLAVGMACVIIIMLWVQYEMSFDKHHEKAERIFRVAKESHINQPPTKAAVTPPPLSPALLHEFPEIEAAVRVCSWEDELFSYGQKHFLESYYAVDPSFFKIFTVHFLEGSKDTALDDPYSIVLTEKMAKKFFGQKNPLGEIIQFGDKADFRVTGIIKNMPVNSHLISDIFLPYESWAKLFEIDLKNWWWNGFYTYILLRPNADHLKLQEKFGVFTEKYGFQSQELFLQPLLSIHLHSHFLGEIGQNMHTSTLILFGSIAVLILLIACINYMNLSTARSSTRLKEVGTRKVVGAHRSQIARQFLGESLVMSFFSLVLSLFLAYLFLPFFNSLAERQLTLNVENLIQILPGILVLILFVGLFAGSYPALLLSSFKPITTLKGGGGRGFQKTRLRNVLVVIQFSTSLILIIATFLVRNQLDYVRNKEMGFAKDQIMVVSIHDEHIQTNIAPVLEELKRNPSVLYASSSQFLPNDVKSSTYANWPGKPDEVRIIINAGEIGYDYTELYEIEIVKGRRFSREFPSDESGAFLINETAMKAMGDDFQLGMGFGHWASRESKGKIVGVMKDFHLHSLHEEIKPVYFFLNPRQGYRISIKIQGGNIPETIDFVQETVKKFSPNYPFDYRFFDDIFNMAYINEQKMERIFSIFALVAIFIACMGVFGLSAFIADQRRKEIGIRKVLGASALRIVYLLSKDLLWLVLAANIIGWPIAYYAMNRWLQNFAYRTNIGIEIFILSAILILVITMGTMSFQAIKSALANPVDSLRYE